MPGSIEAFEQTTLYAKTAGYLKSINVDIGDRVHAGDVIADIDVPEIANERDGAKGTASFPTMPHNVLGDTPIGKRVKVDFPLEIW